MDGAIAQGFADPDRLFVTCGSGGGVLTSWIIGNTNRFKAAATQKPVIDWSTQALTSDIPGTVTHVALGHVDWRVVAALVVGAVPGARLGAHLTIRAEEGRFRAAVAWFLAATAVLYFAEELTALL